MKENLCGVPGIPRGTIEDYARTLHPEWFAPTSCCHETRLLGARCLVGRKCPYDEAAAEGTFEAHLPVRTLPDPTPDDALTDWIYEAF